MKIVFILIMALSVIFYGFVFWEEFLEDFFLEIKSKFSFPKHKDKFLIKQDKKFVWVSKK